MGEHIARYDHVARFLNEKGIAVVGFDHRGHGNSEGKRGHTPNYNQLLSDVEVVLGKTKELYPNVPIFMYGHSMGGNVVLNYALRKKPQVNGIIASSPWIKLAFDPPKFEVALAKFAVNIFPSLLQSTKLDATAISRDANEVQKYLKDPLVHDKISPAFFLGAYQAGLYALENAASFGLPLLIYHGSGDKLTSFAASKEFASKVKKEIVTWHEIKDAYHETHNDIGKEGILTMIADWVLSKI
jgi:alpha-beta hydrolase superfamily lysophospholipase